MTFFESPLFFWICATALTLGAIVSALWPLLKPSARAVESDVLEGTEQVFLDQLQEIERDRERGLLGDEEADGARAEVGRRLLALQREEKSAVKTQSNNIYPWFAIAVIPVFAVGLYSLFGAPGLPDQPMTKRLAEAQETQDIEVLIGQVERHLLKKPDDLRGWMTLAPIYQRRGQFDKAETAYRKILSLNPEEKVIIGSTQNALGQLLAIKTNGRVTPEARTLFTNGMKNAPEDATGFFFDALAWTQANDKDKAIKAWEVFLATFKETNPRWITVAQTTMARLKGEVVSEPKATDRPDNTKEMINAMVEGLAAKLEENPEDGTGWARLIRSYMVLERKDDAAKALETARSALKDKDDALKPVEDVAKEFDL